MRTGGRILVDQLLVHGTDLVFCVPGESFLPVLDALYDVRPEAPGGRGSIRLVVCRQEGGAATMAEAYGKLTGRPGVCFVTRGPGACNAAIAVHTAMQDSTPMILCIGQVGSDCAGREAFQEIDFARMFAPAAKWAAQVDRADRLPEYLARAFAVATSGRPGPVVLALPEDMLGTVAAVPDAERYLTAQAHPGAAELRALGDRLAHAERPLVLAGGSGWTREACAQLERFALRAGLPVATTFRRQDRFDNRHAHYAGDLGIGANPKLAARVRDADLLVVVGARLGEMTTGGYALVTPPHPGQGLVHVHADPAELGRVYQPDVAIAASPATFAAALDSVAVAGERWRAWTQAAHADYLEWVLPEPMPGDVQLGEVVAWLADRLPRDAIVANGAGNYTGWLHRHYRYAPLGTELAPTSGAMGYGVPAAIAAKLLHPERVVVSWNGDGCFLMNGQELATAVQYGANVVFVVVNNGMYGTIRMHQEREHPGRVWGSTLRNPDFAALARAYGAHGELVSRTADFAPAFDRSLAAGRPALIEVRIDPEAITSRTTLAAVRAAALQRTQVRK
jgi:acetolactate synthase-1/2/3 large subunit